MAGQHCSAQQRVCEVSGLVTERQKNMVRHPSTSGWDTIPYRGGERSARQILASFLSIFGQRADLYTCLFESLIEYRTGVIFEDECCSGRVVALASVPTQSIRE